MLPASLISHICSLWLRADRAWNFNSRTPLPFHLPYPKPSPSAPSTPTSYILYPINPRDPLPKQELINIIRVSAKISAKLGSKLKKTRFWIENLALVKTLRSVVSRVYRVPGLLSNRPNWPQGSVAPPPLFGSKGGDTLACYCTYICISFFLHRMDT